MKTLLIASAIFIPFTLPAQVNLSSGLVAYFKMDGTANDTSVVNIDGTLTGTSPTIGINGGSGTALHFTAANLDKFTAGTSDRNITNTVSISCWFKTGSTNLQHLVEKYDWATDRGYALDIYNQKICLLGRNGTGTYYEFYGTTVVTDNKWHHVVGIMNDNVWSIYLDCAFQSTLTTSSGTIANPVAYLALGYYVAGNGGNHLHLDGDMDEVRIYNRVLNTQEINYLCDVASNSISEAHTNQNAMYVYPNPAADWLNIGTENEDVLVRIYDSFGRIALQKPNTSKGIYTGGLAGGCYLVEICGANGLIVGRAKFLKY